MTRSGPLYEVDMDVVIDISGGNLATRSIPPTRMVEFLSPSWDQVGVLVDVPDDLKFYLMVARSKNAGHVPEVEWAKLE